MTASMNGDPASKNWPTCTEEEMICCKCAKNQTALMGGCKPGSLNVLVEVDTK